MADQAAQVQPDAKSGWRSRLAYFAITTVFVLGALEILLRLVSADPDYYGKDRFFFVTPNVYEDRGEGVWTYRPHLSIREAAVYLVPSLTTLKRSYVVEYDCRMRSNNLGLLQVNDVAAGADATVIVGDSFTAGQGGCPWFDRLQARRPSEQLVNGGLLGTGVDQWRRLVGHLQQQGVSIKRLLVIMIADDFKRPVWNWKGANEDFMPPVADDESHAQLIDRTARRAAARFPDDGSIDFVKRVMKQYSYVYKFTSRANQAVKDLIRSMRRGPQDDPGVWQRNVEALRALKGLGVPIGVVLVPQRIETGLVAPQHDRRLAIDALNANGVPFSLCPLVQADFMPRDDHPNAQGYDKLVDCADKALAGMATARNSSN